MISAHNRHIVTILNVRTSTKHKIMLDESRKYNIHIKSISYLEGITIIIQPQ